MQKEKDQQAEMLKQMQTMMSTFMGQQNNGGSMNPDMMAMMQAMMVNQ